MGCASVRAGQKEWESQLRSKTGVEGFEVLYEILGLPPRKLATREQIRRAYRLQSLRYHPDKVLPEEAEEAAEKFLAIKTAYDLLLEGMETGGAGMAGAVFSGGATTLPRPRGLCGCGRGHVEVPPCRDLAEISLLLFRWCLCARRPQVCRMGRRAGGGHAGGGGWWGRWHGRQQQQQRCGRWSKRGGSLCGGGARRDG